MQIITENMFFPEAFEMGISVATSTQIIAVAPPATSSAAEHLGSSDLLIYFLIGTAMLLIFCLVIYLMVEHQRETRELRGPILERVVKSVEEAVMSAAHLPHGICTVGNNATR